MPEEVDMTWVHSQDFADETIFGTNRRISFGAEYRVCTTDVRDSKAKVEHCAVQAMGW